ncbi:uncharacterized protein LOC115753927 [Rhodamnia argentea]|uniref:Uncharacterized protein LOC115753927 n=1 Tax=Rhodamnia argentea TaxID=178133 RepID=A0ABM3GTJ4_9MYRT|nr:uncharacterized protein LOC115753927 [Rhodamnia argentea]XP_048127679.1 uncharacterized protein LOC115753927 [Rhodamnia argentea]
MYLAGVFLGFTVERLCRNQVHRLITMAVNFVTEYSHLKGNFAAGLVLFFFCKSLEEVLHFLLICRISYRAIPVQGELPLFSGIQHRILGWRLSVIWSSDKVQLFECIGKKYVILFFYQLDFTFICPAGHSIEGSMHH